MQKPNIILCRWAPSIGELESTDLKVWGTYGYDPAREDHLRLPCVFFGLYGLPDFFDLWRHQGRKWILWAGSDIQHLLKGYWLDKTGRIVVSAFQLAPWIDTYCESYVENEVEKAALASVGIRAKVVPSFLGDIDQFPVSYKPSGRPRLYTSVSGTTSIFTAGTRSWTWPNQIQTLSFIFMEI
jgi:hypothetical protein